MIIASTSEMLTVLLVATAIAFAVSLLIVFSEGWHGRHSMDHDLSGIQKFHTTAVPRIGGVAVIVGLYVTIVGCERWYPGLFFAFDGASGSALLVASLPVFIAGIVEDLTKRVSVRVRLAAAMLSALSASIMMGVTVDELDIWGIDALLTVAPIAVLVTAVVVAGGINAVNFIDGFNGLAGSVVIIMSTALGFLAWQAGDEFVVALAALGIGVTLGFLMVNFPTGRLFLGDAGAYLLGFWVAEIAVLLLTRNAEINSWQVLAICAYPVIEVLFSIYRRKVVRRASPGAPDRLHMHSLVYRRVVPRLLPYHAGKPWIRNAAVAVLVAPVVALSAFIAVVAGETIAGAAAVVTGQVLLYVGVYARLVRGHWRRPADRSVLDTDVKVT